jgi:glycerophosphoryl diester phosphodiesterase
MPNPALSPALAKVTGIALRDRSRVEDLPMLARPRHSFALAAAAAAAAMTCFAAPPAHAWNTLDGAPPLVIGHRGASGYLPEHTLASYERAIELGADYIEPDLVSTKDGVLIARHEPMLGGTTDVASRPEFAALRTTMIVDGVPVTDWFASDFTLAQIKTLRAIQPRLNRPQEFNGRYEIPTLDEVIALARTKGAALGRTVGIYPETKHPTFHQSIGLPLEDRLVERLAAAGLDRADAPVFIQSFEVANLKALDGKTDVRLVQLIDADDVRPDGSLSLVAPYDKPYDFVVSGDPRTYADLLTPAGLAEIATYADGIGPWKPWLLKTAIFDPDNDGIANDRDGDGDVDLADRVVIGDTGVIDAAHAAGLLVHAFTFRDDASQYGFADATSEYRAYYALGVDGVFSDFPDTARAAVVPEPSTWAWLVGGLAVLGIGVRRRRF